MVIGDDDIDSRVLEGADRLVCARAAIAGHDDTNARSQGRFDARGPEVVTILDAPRDERNDRSAEQTKCSREQRRRAHAIHVVITVDEYLLMVANCPLQPLDGAIEVEHETWIVELIQSRAEVHLCSVDVAEAAGGEQPAQRLRQMQLLLQAGNGRRIGSLGDDPAMLRARARSGGGHAAKSTAGTTLEQASF